MTRCNAIGALTVGGRVVGSIRCDLEAGHDQPTHYHVPGEGLTQPHEWEPGTPHAQTLTWTPEEEPDLDLFDPREVFDVDVPMPAVQYAPELWIDADVRSALHDAYAAILDAANVETPPRFDYERNEWAGNDGFPVTDLDRADLYGDEE